VATTRFKAFTCLDQFLSLAFPELTFRESLRDIEACLHAQQPKLYHMGFWGAISRSNLGYANEHRAWRIYADFAHVPDLWAARGEIPRAAPANPPAYSPYF
jgi:hypothetical protein